MNDLASQRREYRHGSLSEREVEADPLAQLRRWLDEALAAEVLEPTAMALATVDEKSRPSARTVLLKGLDKDGLVFYTNYESRKSQELDANPAAAALFFWKELDRQIRVEGEAARMPEAESNAYFQSRPRGSRLGAWASPQSQVLLHREELEARFAEIEGRFAEGEIPLPPFWGGYRLTPHTFEFWQGRESRLHDRLRYRSVRGGWKVERLAP